VVLAELEAGGPKPTLVALIMYRLLRFFQNSTIHLLGEGKYGVCMSALGWELPLDVICVNGSFAQIVYFAK
jgi:hypothetical protein